MNLSIAKVLQYQILLVHHFKSAHPHLTEVTVSTASFDRL